MSQTLEIRLPNAVADGIANIIAGTRLALLMPVRREDFRCNIDQLVVLVLIGVLLFAGFDFIAAGPNPHFEISGVVSLAALYLLSFFAAYVIARLQHALKLVLLLIIVNEATGPVQTVAWTVGEMTLGGPDMAYQIAYALIFLFIYLPWVVVITYRIIRLVFDSTNKRAAFLVALYFALSYLPAFAFPELHIWVGEKEDQATESSTPLDQETLDRVDAFQEELIATTTATLEADRPGIPDLYFVGFGSYASEDVFLNETRSVRALFDSRFDTAGRSVILVNNVATFREVPLASVPNLKAVLARVSELMAPHEDILFLFLTSHGSRDHLLSVRFASLPLDDLPADDLKRMLDDAGIKWRVIVVSACYSGGFIEALKDEHSLIMTAARADRTSFGCSHKRRFTYFGEAYFDQQLRHEFSFIQAFSKARHSIAEWEANDDLPPSLPQIHVGRAIEAKLAAFEAHVRRLDGGATAN